MLEEDSNCSTFFLGCAFLSCHLAAGHWSICGCSLWMQPHRSLSSSLLCCKPEPFVCCLSDLGPCAGDHVGIDPSDLTAGGAYIYNRSKNGSQRTIVQKQTEAQRLAAAAGAARPSAAHGAAASQHGLLELSQSTQPHATAVSHSEGGSPMAHPPVDTHETTAAAAAAAAAPGGMVAPPPPPLTASGEGNAVPPAAVATRRQRRPAAQRTLDGAAATGAMGDGAAAAGQEAGCGGGSGEGEDKAALLLELEDVQAQINEKVGGICVGVWQRASCSVWCFVGCWWLGGWTC